MRNKGFTLIELLAVIVILAIIALIATPIVLGIIEDARNNTKERTAELILSGIQNAYTSYMMAKDGSEPKTFCSTTDGFMNTTYFTVNNAIIDTCNDTALAGKYTATVKNDGFDYTVTYDTSDNGRVIEISGFNGDKKKTATLAATSESAS